MSDHPAGSVEGDVPVNPYSLLESVTATSADARRGVFVFLLLLAYTALAAAGITHKDLLLDRDVALPLARIGVGLDRFLLAVPVIVLMAHVALLLQHAMLARKVLAFDQAVRGLESTDRSRHPLRLELHAYGFTQAMAGPERSALLGSCLHLQTWTILVALPVCLLAAIQLIALPLHDAGLTWLHRVVISVDLAMVCWIGVFLLSPDGTWRAVNHGPRGGPAVVLPILTIVFACAVAVLTLLFATIPGEPLDQIVSRAPASTVLGARRSLVVTDTTLVDERTLTAGKVTVNLRSRDLRNARLDRSDLQQADFSGADLSGASLMATDVRGAQFGCLDLDVQKSGKREAAGCARLVGAVLRRANALAAQFGGADLTGADLSEAQLSGADFSGTLLLGARLPKGAERGDGERGPVSPASDTPAGRSQDATGNALSGPFPVPETSGR